MAAWYWASDSTPWSRSCASRCSCDIHDVSSAATAGDEASWVAQLHKLAQLHDQGVLSDEQYEAAKRRVLEQKPQ